MSVNTPAVEEIVRQVKALPSEDLARLDAELGELRRGRMRSLTQTVRKRTRGVGETEIRDAVNRAVDAVRTEQPT